MDSISRNPVQFAHIVNTQLGKATISDTMGYFVVQAVEQNELQISAIGYAMKRIILDDSIMMTNHLPIIQLAPYIYPISSIRVNPLGSYEHFKQRFMVIRPMDPKYKIAPSVLKDIELGTDTLDLINTAPIMSPVTFLYERFSKEGKSRRKLAQLYEEERFKAQIAYKYNSDLVARITGYTDFELYEFMDFCSFKKEFLLEASDYQIIESILDNKKNFIKSREN